MTIGVPPHPAIQQVLSRSFGSQLCATLPDIPSEFRVRQTGRGKMVLQACADAESPALDSVHCVSFTWDGVSSHAVGLKIVKAERNRQSRLLLTLVPEDDEQSQALWRILAAKPRAMRERNRAWPKLPGRTQHSEQGRQSRLSFIRSETGATLEHVARTRLVAETLNRNIESFIGSVEVPVGLAGPLLFHGQHVQGHVFAPMATTEGSLVASTIRGAAAMTAAGGVETRVLGRHLSRVPLLQMNRLQDAVFLADWVKFHFDEVRAQTLPISRFADLKSIEPHILGREVHLHFMYETGDSAGQNMVTGCTWQACHWIIEQMKERFGIPVVRYMIEANLSSDKKVTYNAWIQGRGTRAVAECRLSRDVTQRFLHVTPEQLVRGFHALSRGAVASGMIGNNVNSANMVAAIFTATGQDIGSVHESSMAQLSVELEDGGEMVYATLHMPSLLVGTVGGGTSLPGQKECLQLMNAAGVGGSERLAEIICGYALALDLSTLAALSSDEFASAHHPLVEPLKVARVRASEDKLPTA